MNVQEWLETNELPTTVAGHYRLRVNVVIRNKDRTNKKLVQINPETKVGVFIPYKSLVVETDSDLGVYLHPFGNAMKDITESEAPNDEEVIEFCRNHVRNDLLDSLKYASERSCRSLNTVIEAVKKGLESGYIKYDSTYDSIKGSCSTKDGKFIKVCLVGFKHKRIELVRCHEWGKNCFPNKAAYLKAAKTL